MKGILSSLPSEVVWSEEGHSHQNQIIEFRKGPSLIVKSSLSNTQISGETAAFRHLTSNNRSTEKVRGSNFTCPYRSLYNNPVFEALKSWPVIRTFQRADRRTRSAGKLVILAGSDGLDGGDEIIKLCPRDFFHNLSPLQDLESRNHPYPELFRQRLISVARHRETGRELEPQFWC